ncbi:ABC transporter permease [Kitasatospora albolonga]|uniref:ABC transporter permease n=1 Tax=Kitasatospora albolonga TaxID=68173 RepID=A0ABC8BNS7_9ACTN|nr:ABC transporter permease [Kitasatospora albolonga]
MAWHDGTVTAPLTPPHQPNPHDPWQAPPSGSHLAPAYGSPDDPDTATELRQAAAVVALLTLSGIALGLLWLWLAPRVPLVSDGSAVFLENSEGEEAIGADGTFVLLAVAFGLVSAAAVFWRLRRGGVYVVLGLALGGVLGSLVAWRVGVWLGPSSDVVSRAREVGKGVAFDAPLELHAAAVAVLVWSIVAMAAHLALTGVFGPRDPEPEWGGAGWSAYYGGPGEGAPGGPGAPGSGAPGAGVPPKPPVVGGGSGAS